MRIPRRPLAVVATWTVALGVVACGSSTAPPAESNSGGSTTWPAFVQSFIDGYVVVDPAFGIYQGRHELDGQIPDWSPDGLRRRIAFLKGAVEGAAMFDPTTLSVAQRFERDYLMQVAKGELFWLEDADSPHTNPAWYINGGLDPNVYVARPYADAATRMKAFIAYAKAIPAAAMQIKANLKTPMPVSFIDLGVPGFKGLASYYQNETRAAFAEVTDGALKAEFDAAVKPAAQAMNDMASWLEGLRPTATRDYALGEAKFARMLLATELVDTPLAELEAIGRADLERNQKALRGECAVFAPGQSIQACMAKMNATKPSTGPVADARTQLPLLRQFLIDNEVVSIPGPEQALVEESPPFKRQNAAYIDIPGPYEKGLPSVYYLAPPDPSWTREQQDAYIPGSKDLLFTSVHEVWPGHFLNFLHSNRASSLFGRVFVGYAFAEGWGHYAEELMWDAGLGKGDAETHIGQLSNALLRNCRFLSAIGLHARGMTQEQSKEMFLRECYQDEGNARQQSARGTYDPAYLNYTMGKLMIRRLRDDWSVDKGGRKAWKQFHDTFLGYGGPPIPLVRGAMMGGGPKATF